MVDGFGSTVFAWTDGDQLAGETGPWAAVNYTYNNARQRSAMSLSQPGVLPWTQGYGYDTVMRLASTVSPAGNFTYSYFNFAYSGSDRVDKLNYGNSYVQNKYDYLARLTGTALHVPSPFTSPASQFQYSYDVGSERTQQVFTAGNVMNYTYATTSGS